MLVGKSKDTSIDCEVHLLSSLQEDSSDKEDASFATLSFESILSPAVGSNSDALQSSISTFFSQISGMSDLTDVNEADVRRLRNEIASLQSKVASKGDEMPVSDLIKYVERLLKVEEELVVEEDNLKNSRSTCRETMDSASEDSSTYSFEEEDFGESLVDTSSVHPMQKLVTSQDMQDSLPTPLVGNKKSLGMRVDDMQDSTPRIGNTRKSLPNHTTSVLSQRWETDCSDRSEFCSPIFRQSGGSSRNVRSTACTNDSLGSASDHGVLERSRRSGGSSRKIRSTTCTNNSLGSASDHGGLQPIPSSVGGFSTRWARNSSMRHLEKDSCSASDALNFKTPIREFPTQNVAGIWNSGDKVKISKSSYGPRTFSGR
ncbi:unnamed protein product [Cylindrotheca closterium]|uniref:Uncharacterized protein n=1 Tax=Cylindrotheca closterium TaxID=2856 RepID=A0AAD2PXH4_9STRA|nr:unnamed protein product [Cylindrotheca closterium]